MDKAPLVSIVMITYGHEQFIKQSVMGVLNQETNFEIELIIANDCSPDNTAAVVDNIINTHPKGRQIRFINRESNVGMTPNFIDALNQCKGKYVALCEGDDYWIDNQKLQFQVDFLESNPDFSVCFHSIYELIDGKQEFLKVNYSPTDGVYSLEDLAREGNFIPTLSVVFRNNLVNNLPDWFAKCPLGDYVLHLLNGQFGKYKGFDKPMAVYRRHEGGVYSMIALDKKIIMLVDTLSELMKHFGEHIEKVLSIHRDSVFEHLIRFYYLEKNCEKAEQYIHYGLSVNPQLANKIATELLPVLIKNIYSSNRYRMGDKIAKMLKTVSPGNIIHFLKK